MHVIGVSEKAGEGWAFKEIMAETFPKHEENYEPIDPSKSTNLKCKFGDRQHTKTHDTQTAQTAQTQ